MPKKIFSKADLKIKPFDSADYLTGPDMILGYLNEVIATGNPGDLGAAAIIQHALGVAARAHGMTKVAKATGLSREISIARCRRRTTPTSAPSCASSMHSDSSWCSNQRKPERSDRRRRRKAASGLPPRFG